MSRLLAATFSASEMPGALFMLTYGWSGATDLFYYYYYWLVVLLLAAAAWLFPLLSLVMPSEALSLITAILLTFFGLFL